MNAGLVPVPTSVSAPAAAASSAVAAPTTATTISASASVSAAPTSSTAATTSVAAAPSAAISATGLGRPLAGFIDDQGPSAAILAIQAVDRRFAVGVIRHLHESKAAAAACFTVHYHFGLGNFAVLFEELFELRRTIRPGQIAHINPLRHSDRSLSKSTKRTNKL
jgi:hypothetical protein